METMAASQVGFKPTMDSRLVLLAGFGGLLILMAFAGVDGIQALQQIQSSNDRIRDQFLLRTQVLERIRGDLYLSGTDVRDYLLEPHAGIAMAIGFTSVWLQQVVPDIRPREIEVASNAFQDLRPQQKLVPNAIIRCLDPLKGLNAANAGE